MMGIASMVIGIVSLMIGFIPFCGTWAIVPASVGIGLGIADVIIRSKQNQPRGMAIAGLVLNPLAVTIILLYWITAFSAARTMADSVDTDMSNQILKAMQNMQDMQNLPGMPSSGQGTPIPSPPLPGAVPQPMEPMQPVSTDDTAPGGQAAPLPAEQPAP
jgi:hypothetical protein